MIEAELDGHRRKRATLEAKEAEMTALLETHNAEYTNTGNDLAELEEMNRKRVRFYFRWTWCAALLKTAVPQCD